MILATLETRHFEFQVVTETQDEAEQLLTAAWGLHQQQTGAEAAWIDVADDVQYWVIQPGTVYRNKVRLRAVVTP